MGFYCLQKGIENCLLGSEIGLGGMLSNPSKCFNVRITLVYYNLLRARKSSMPLGVLPYSLGGGVPLGL